MITATSLSGLSDVRHAFFTREGGVSGGLYASRNCGYGSHDRQDHVRENRRRAAVDLGAEAQALVTVHQTHSNRALFAEAPWQPQDAPKADALVCDRPGIALGILTADCAPVLFADPDAGVVGAAHAGWRGALTGILDNTVAEMERRGADRGRIVAAIGPRIGHESYEVGPEFYERFVAEDAGSAGHFSQPSGNGRHLFDIAGYIVRRLRLLGLDRVEAVAHDTFAEEARFFSYRRSVKRGEPDYGRCLSAIALGV